MDLGPIETYHTRKVTDLGVWNKEIIQFKIYGLLATNKLVSSDMIEIAGRFVDEEVLIKIEEMGDSNGLGFIIIHPGDAGLSVSVHWWTQGSVLCQHIYRHEYNADAPMDTIFRPVIGCVWELEVINAEQNLWQRTMMQSAPDHSAYIKNRPIKIYE